MCIYLFSRWQQTICNRCFAAAVAVALLTRKMLQLRHAKAKVVARLTRPQVALIAAQGSRKICLWLCTHTHMFTCQQREMQSEMPEVICGAIAKQSNEEILKFFIAHNRININFDSL